MKNHSRLSIVAVVIVSAILVSGEDNLFERYLSRLKPPMETCAQKLGLTKEELAEVHLAGKQSGKLACFRSCVMMELKSLSNGKIVLDEINALIDEIHAGNPEQIAKVKQMAADCAPLAEAEGEDCKVATKFSDCYIQKVMTGL